MNKYLNYQYKVGARGEDNFIDCWGLTRLVRTEVYNKPLLPIFEDAKLGNSKEIDKAYRVQSIDLKEVDKCEGAIIACLRKGVCVHVAIMIKNNEVLEIKKEGQKARILSFRDFIKHYQKPIWKVKFYD